MRAALERMAVLAALAALLVACGPPPYSLTAPEAFKRYEDSRDFKLITADGVMLKAREVDNYPKADLSFWAEALGRHLDARGYAKKSEHRFKTNKGLEGFTLTFVLPHGAEDYVLSETIFVVGDTVYLVEAAGPFERFAAVEKELDAALATFDPGK